MKYPIFLLLPLVLCCATNHGAKSSSNDSVWAPEGFKTEHPDEWTVVNTAINIQQRDGETDFAEIDKLVKEYLTKAEIALPSDAAMRIQCIDEVCRGRFDISNYDNSNAGMLIADGSRRLFDKYINWLYEKEARVVLGQNKFVDVEREMELFKGLNDALYDVCDSVAFRMDGSGGWCGASQIEDLSIDYNRCMWQAIMGISSEHSTGSDISLDLFDKECESLNESYEPYDDNQPKDVSEIINRFKSAFHSWYMYRKSVAENLEDENFKTNYESITDNFARIHFIHLKNEFSDIGLQNCSTPLELL